MDGDFWFSRWREGRIGFHRADTNPALVRWWSRLGLGTEATVLVPLCGKSKDLIWLGEHHSVVGVELSEMAKEQFWLEASLEPQESTEGVFIRSHSGSMTFLVGDFMALPTVHSSGFDGFYDRAALIALPPNLRKKYADTLKTLIVPGGRGLLVTIEYDQNEMDGPPFSVSEDMVRDLYEPHFKIEVLETSGAEPVSPNLAKRGVTSMTGHVFLLTRTAATNAAS